MWGLPPQIRGSLRAEARQSGVPYNDRSLEAISALARAAAMDQQATDIAATSVVNFIGANGPRMQYFPRGHPAEPPAHLPVARLPAQPVREAEEVPQPHPTNASAAIFAPAEDWDDRTYLSPFPSGFDGRKRSVILGKSISAPALPALPAAGRPANQGGVPASEARLHARLGALNPQQVALLEKTLPPRLQRSLHAQLEAAQLGDAANSATAATVPSFFAPSLPSLASLAPAAPSLVRAQLPAVHTTRGTGPAVGDVGSLSSPPPPKPKRVIFAAPSSVDGSATSPADASYHSHPGATSVGPGATTTPGCRGRTSAVRAIASSPMGSKCSPAGEKDGSLSYAPVAAPQKAGAAEVDLGEVIGVRIDVTASPDDESPRACVSLVFTNQAHKPVEGGSAGAVGVDVAGAGAASSGGAAGRGGGVRHRAVKLARAHRHQRSKERARVSSPKPSPHRGGGEDQPWQLAPLVVDAKSKEAVVTELREALCKCAGRVVEHFNAFDHLGQGYVDRCEIVRDCERPTGACQ